MKTDLERISDKLDDMATDISSINITLAEQAMELKEHIRRTGLAESRITALELVVEENQKTTYMIKGVLMTVGGFGALLTLAATLWMAFKA